MDEPSSIKRRLLLSFSLFSIHCRAAAGEARERSASPHAGETIKRTTGTTINKTTGAATKKTK